MFRRPNTQAVPHVLEHDLERCRILMTESLHVELWPTTEFLGPPRKLARRVMADHTSTIPSRVSLVCYTSHSNAKSFPLMGRWGIAKWIEYIYSQFCHLFNENDNDNNDEGGMVMRIMRMMRKMAPAICTVSFFFSPKDFEQTATTCRRIKTRRL